MADCKHIVGFTQGYDEDDEPNRLIYEGECGETTGDIDFNFCPLCGIELEWNPKRMTMEPVNE